MNILASIQPCYLPWRGYFHVIQQSDIFVFADNLQYNKQNWRNRNRIKTVNGPIWLTVPIQRQSSRGRANINEVMIDNSRQWGLGHWDMICQAYHRAPFFEKYQAFFKEMLFRQWEKLDDLVICLTEYICNLLKIKVQFVRASDIDVQGRKMDYLVDMCRKLDATHYLSGPSAKSYIEEEKLKDIGVTLQYQNYNYPTYPQLHGQFADHMSIIDLLFNCGDQAPCHIWELRHARK